MSNYNAPIRDMQFVMRELAGLDEVTQLPGNEEVSADLEMPSSRKRTSLQAVSSRP